MGLLEEEQILGHVPQEIFQILQVYSLQKNGSKTTCVISGDST